MEVYVCIEIMQTFSDPLKWQNFLKLQQKLLQHFHATCNLQHGLSLANKGRQNLSSWFQVQRVALGRLVFGKSRPFAFYHLRTSWGIPSFCSSWVVCTCFFLPNPYREYLAILLSLFLVFCGSLKRSWGGKMQNSDFFQKRAALLVTPIINTAQQNLNGLNYCPCHYFNIFCFDISIFAFKSFNRCQFFNIIFFLF